MTHRRPFGVQASWNLVVRIIVCLFHFGFVIRLKCFLPCSYHSFCGERHQIGWNMRKQWLTAGLLFLIKTLCCSACYTDGIMWNMRQNFCVSQALHGLFSFQDYKDLIHFSFKFSLHFLTVGFNVCNVRLTENTSWVMSGTFEKDGTEFGFHS